MNISVSKRATKQLLKLSQKKANVFVSTIYYNDCENKCSSFNFKFTPSSEHKQIFDEIKKLDKYTNLIIEEPTLMDLVDTEIDYVKKKFIFKNNELSFCKCGSNLIRN